jgi:hypothetical protein
MGNITETDHFEKLQEELEEKDKCTVCSDDSLYDKTMPIDLRLGYIETSGQLCLECYDKIYNKGAKKDG